MLPTRRVHRGRIIAAVVVSLAFHGVLGLGWFALRPSATGGIANIPTEVDGPDDREFVINLREPPVPRVPVKSKPTPPQPLPSTLIGSSINDVVPAKVSDFGYSPSATPDLPKNPGKPLHGKLKPGKSIVYALDRSSSMGSDGLLQSACRAIKDSLSQLNPECRFQIVAYNAGISTPADEPQLATEANVSRAGRWLDELVAEGSSDHRAGLRDAIAFHPDAVFLLTDADDLDEREVRSMRTLLRKPVYLSVAIFGEQRSKESTPLERLANEMGGVVKYVGR